MSSRATNLGKPTSHAFCAMLLLAMITLVFAQTGSFKFLRYDDDVYVTENQHIQSGDVPERLSWALTTFYAANWHPLTWLSHMLDWRWFAADPRGHHFTNLALHGLTSLVLFVWLSRTVGGPFPAFVAAGWFAIHPLRAEPVAWVSQRKELLAALLGMLTVCAYVWYTRRSDSWRRYLLVVVLLALGLMAKPVLVTLPVALLLLDFWPLKRWPPGDGMIGGKPVSPVRLVLEKVPLLAMAGFCSTMTMMAQRHAGAVAVTGTLSLRLENILLAYGAYLRRTVWPSGLTFIYPYPDEAPRLAMIAGAAIAMVGITAFVLARWHRQPYLAVGWFWFIGSLVPMIGLVQVGLQSTADRYTYWPHVGVALALCASLAGLQHRYQNFRVQAAWAGVAAVVLLALGVTCWRLTACWHDTLSLTDRALALDPTNYVAHQVRGWALARENRLDEAYEHYHKAVELRPTFAEGRVQLAMVLLGKGRIDEAAVECRRAIRDKPKLGPAYQILGVVQSERGQTDEALRTLEMAVLLSRDERAQAAAESALGFVYWQKGRTAEAAVHCRHAVELVPRLASAHLNLGLVLASQEKWPEAAQQIEQAMALESRERAVVLAKQANRLTHFQSPEFLDRLAAGYAAVSRFDDAIEVTRLAIKQARATGHPEQVAALEAKIEQYRGGGHPR